MDTSSQNPDKEMPIWESGKYKWRIQETDGEGERGRFMFCQLELVEDDRRVCVRACFLTGFDLASENVWVSTTVGWALLWAAG